MKPSHHVGLPPALATLSLLLQDAPGPAAGNAPLQLAWEAAEHCTVRPDDGNERLPPSQRLTLPERQGFENDRLACLACPCFCRASRPRTLFLILCLQLCQRLSHRHHAVQIKGVAAHRAGKRGREAPAREQTKACYGYLPSPAPPHRPLPHVQMRGWRTATQRIHINHVDQDGRAHDEVTGSCKELDAALQREADRAGGSGGQGRRGGTSDSGAELAACLDALLELCRELRASL